MNNGDRPPFDVHGAWLYSGENPIVHLVEVSKHLETTGNIDHFALKAQEYEKMCEKLFALSIPFELLCTQHICSSDFHQGSKWSENRTKFF